MSSVEEDTSVYLTDAPIAPPARGGRRIGALTAGLVILLAATAGFVAGVKVQRHQGSTSSLATAGFAAFANGNANRARTGQAGQAGANPAGGAGGAGGFGGATVGTVKLVDGDSIYVTTASGDIVKVKATKGSTVTKSSTATVGDVHPGDTVVVQGEAGPDGTVTATRINDGGSGGAAGGGRRFGGQGG